MPPSDLCCRVECSGSHRKVGNIRHLLCLVSDHGMVALGDYLDHKDFKNLATMNALFSDAEGAKLICAVFKSHVQVWKTAPPQIQV